MFMGCGAVARASTSAWNDCAFECVWRLRVSPPTNQPLIAPLNLTPHPTPPRIPPRPIFQTTTFAVNYVGEPFNTPLLENRLFAASVRWSAALYVALVIDIPRGEFVCWCIVCSVRVAAGLPRCICGWAPGAALPPTCSRRHRHLQAGAEYASLQASQPPTVRLLTVPPADPSLFIPLAPTTRPLAGVASWFSLVSIPGSMQAQMLLFAAAAFVVATAIERTARRAFPAEIPPEKGPMVSRQRGGARRAEALKNGKDD